MQASTVCKVVSRARAAGGKVSSEGIARAVAVDVALMLLPSEEARRHGKKRGSAVQAMGDRDDVGVGANMV